MSYFFRIVVMVHVKEVNVLWLALYQVQGVEGGAAVGAGVEEGAAGAEAK